MKAFVARHRQLDSAEFRVIFLVRRRIGKLVIVGRLFDDLGHGLRQVISGKPPPPGILRDLLQRVYRISAMAALIMVNVYWQLRRVW